VEQSAGFQKSAADANSVYPAKIVTLLRFAAKLSKGEKKRKMD
jgi:hypothetical protein